MDGHLTTVDKQRLERIALLRRRREEVLSLPPEAALNRILDDKQPVALVHSFPEEDFYFLIHDIGLGDAMPLLSLASDRQREFILDMEGWRRDRLQIQSLTSWLNVMFLADPDRVINWLLKEQTDLLELLLFRNIQVVLREHDKDPSDFGDDFFTHDDVYYVRILDEPLAENLPQDATEKLQDDQRRGFIYRFLARLANLDHIAYQTVLLDAADIMPAEVEEEVYRMRNVRMAEKGFLPFEEAIGIYQPADPEDLQGQPVKDYGRSEDVPEMSLLPLYPVKMLQGGAPFSDTLQTIDSSVLLQRIQLEFVSLCNQVISADQKKIQAKIALREIVEKVCGYLNIGLESGFAGGELSPNQKSVAMASLIQRCPLSKIFRFGYGKALSLKWQAERWRKEAWYEKSGLPLTFWGEKWLGVLGGLMIEKPLYFDNYQTGGTLYREFGSLQDIRSTEQVLSDIMGVDSLLAGMSIQCRQDANHLLTWQNLILTLWARSQLGLGKSTELDAQGRLSPLPIAGFKTFFMTLFAPGLPVDTSLPGKTAKNMKIEFLAWLSGRSELPSEEITGRFGAVFDDLFEQVDMELGSIQPEALDPRFIHLFRIK